LYGYGEERGLAPTLRAGAKDSRDYFFFAAGFATFFVAFFAAGAFAAAFASTFFAMGAPPLSGFVYDLPFFREYARKNDEAHECSLSDMLGPDFSLHTMSIGGTRKKGSKEKPSSEYTGEFLARYESYGNPGGDKKLVHSLP
jgi:hypothetical protein